MDDTSLSMLNSTIPKGRTRPHLTQKQKVKTELCRNITEAGRCLYEDRCLFAHSMEELRRRPTNPKFRKDKCKTFHNDGFCGYGTRCSFKHVVEEEQRTELDRMVANFFRWKAVNQAAGDAYTSSGFTEPHEERSERVLETNSPPWQLAR